MKSKQIEQPEGGRPLDATTRPARRLENPTEDAPEEKRSRHRQFISGQYPSLAAFAWEGFQERGRGTLLVMPPTDGIGCQIRYLSLDEIEPGSPDSPEPQIRRYTPDTQFVITMQEDGNESTYVIGDRNLTPPQAHEQSKGLSSDTVDESDEVFAEVRREDVEAGDLRPIVEALEATRILRPGDSYPNALRRRRGMIHIPVKGYDLDPRELWDVPEVVRFWRKLHEVWPYGLYFLSHRAGSVQLLILSHIQFTAQRGGPEGQVALRVDKNQVVGFIRGCLEPYIEVSRRAGFPDEDGNRYLHEIASLFGIPGEPAGQ